MLLNFLSKSSLNHRDKDEFSLCESEQLNLLLWHIAVDLELICLLFIGFV